MKLSRIDMHQGGGGKADGENMPAGSDEEGGKKKTEGGEKKKKDMKRQEEEQQTNNGVHEKEGGGDHHHHHANGVNISSNEDSEKKEDIFVEQPLRPGMARPVIIHRAILGSIERMCAVLIEHTAGKLPFWLSPRQCIVLPISDKVNDYATSVRDTLHAFGKENKRRHLFFSFLSHQTTVVSRGSPFYAGEVWEIDLWRPDTSQKFKVAGLCIVRHATV